MNDSLNNLDIVRQYLLGRISDEKMLEEIEELLFLDEDFCTKAEIVEDELINDFVFGKLNAEDNSSFAQTLENNADRRSKVKVTQILKEKTATASASEKVSFFEALKAIFRQPIYAGGFALLLIAIIIGAILLSRPPNNPELAELKNIYKDNRPTESRIAEFDYAPYEVTRGAETQSEAEKRKLKIIENDLLKKVDSSPIANNHNTLGIFYLSQKKYSEAIKELEEAVKLEPNNARFHNDLGSALFESGKNAEKEKSFITLSRANESFSKALEINPNFLPAIFNKSLYLQENRLFLEAKKSWENYLQKDSTSKWADEARKNLEKIAQIQSSLNKTKENVLNDFLTAYRNQDEKTVWQIHNSTKGLLNQIPLTAQLTQQFLEAGRNKDDTIAKESIESLTYIGNLEKEKHADFFFADLADYYAKFDVSKVDDLLQAKAVLSAGLELISKREAKLAGAKFEESKRIFKKIGNEIESNLADLWASQMLIYESDLKLSSVRMTKLLEISNKNKHQVISANLFYYLGMCNYRQGNYSQSIKDLQNSLKISQKTENKFEISHAAGFLSNTFADLGDLPKSLEFIYLAGFEGNSYYSNQSQIRKNLRATATLALKTDYRLTAIDFAGEALGLSKIADKPGEVIESYYYLIDALTENKKFDEALKIADQSIKIGGELEATKLNKKTLADEYQIRADLKRKMNLCESALADYQTSLEFYTAESEVSYNTYDLEKSRLLCFKQLNRTNEFNSGLENVLRLSEVVRHKIKEDSLRQTYFENEQIIFDLAIENAISQNEKEKAFNYVETSKSRSLLDFVRSENKSIVEVEQDFSNITKPYSLTEIQAQLPENVQIVEISVLPNKIAVWLITKNRFELSEKPIEDDKLSQQITEYQSLIKTKGNADLIRKIATELYQLLIPENLEKDKILCLIPDKSLHRIPFASLVSAQQKYLMEEFALQNSPSSSVFVALTENARKKNTEEFLLSIGNPKFDRDLNQNLADLPDAEIEAGEIVKNYQNSHKFIGHEATKQTFIENLPNAEILHFAGHFAVNEHSLENSRMLFADQDLYAFELAKIKLPKAKLAVLSACETGLEKLNNSEGAIGIYRTFLAFGTPLVVASNWKVESSATKALMISFHQKRKIAKLSSIESLRQAQLEMLRKPELTHPYYWSAFSISGGYAEY